MTGEPVPKEPEAFDATTANTLSAIGNRIRELRQARGLTLQSLAEACALSQSMLSLVERGRASPSIGSLIVIANALGVPMSDLIVEQPADDSKFIVRHSDQRVIRTATNVIRRLMREDRLHGISIAMNEYQPNTGANADPIKHDGYEYGIVLEGTLTVEINGAAHILNEGDLISYSSRRPHRIWNHGSAKVRTLWINLQQD